MNNLHLSDLRLGELWYKIRRGVWYALLLLLFLLLQDVVFSHIAPLGVRSMFMPVLVTAVGLFEGGTRGGWFGLAAGALCDLSLGSQTVMFTVLFPLIGFATGFFTDFFLNRRLFSYAVMSVAALLLAAFCQMFGLLIFRGENSWALWRTALLQTLWSVPFLFPAYYICKILPRSDSTQMPSPY